MLTYGDGVSDIDLDALPDSIAVMEEMVTVTAVHPGARFGELVIDSDKVESFCRKASNAKWLINGGYFVIEPEFFDFLEGDSTVLEKEPLETVARLGELMAYRHEGFWQCMDTKDTIYWKTCGNRVRHVGQYESQKAYSIIKVLLE